MEMSANAATQPAANGRIHHFKLVLLGDTAVGKSCLVVRFVRDEFFEFQEPTIGGKLLVASDYMRCGNPPKLFFAGKNMAVLFLVVISLPFEISPSKSNLFCSHAHSRLFDTDGTAR